MKHKIGIFSTLYNFDPAYSLVSVIKDQLVTHVKNGYEPVLFVLESFRDDDMIPEGVEIRKVVPQIILEPYAGLNYPENWQEDVDKVVAALKAHADDIEIMITHDIIFIDTYIPYNIALRQAELSCKYLHWVHSAPSPRPNLENNIHANRYTLPPNSKIVYLNHDKVVAVAEMFATWPRNVKVVPNSRDPRTFWSLHPLVREMIDKYDLFSADIISVYPVSTTRMMDGKQLGVIIKIHAALRRLGYTTRLIVPNAHANAPAEKELVEKLSTQNVIFTSNQTIHGLKGTPYEMGVSSNIVADLFRLSNVFIFPSVSENCSLILLEAMLSGNLLVLNKDCSGFQEFGGNNALYFKMGNLDMGTRNEEEALRNGQYIEDIARIIQSEFENNAPLQAKRRTLKEFNYDAIFEKIESLYYLKD